MLKHCQLIMAAAGAAAVLIITVAASLTTLAQGVPPPAVTAVSPESGNNALPATITITGTGYVATPTILLGNISLTNVTFLNSTTLTGSVPADLPTGAYTLTVTNPDAQSTSLTNAFTVLSSGDATLGAWAEIVSMPSLRDWPAVASSGDNIYVLGGGNPNFWTNSNMLSSVDRTRIGSTSALEPWQTASPMTTPRSVLAAATHQGHLYALGGWGHLATVEKASINADGSLGDWQATTAMGTGRQGLAAVVSRDFLYVLGGEFKTSVERAAINPDGSLGAWQDMSAMITARGYLASVVVGNYLYAIGGQNAIDGALKTVERATINADGSLGAWTAMTSMVKSRCDVAAAASRGYIYALGGATCQGIYYPTVERAKVNPDGSLGAWEIVGSMNVSRWRAGAVLARSFLYAIGGTDDTNAVLTTVERAEVSPFSFASLSPALVPADRTTTITAQGVNFVPAATLGFGNNSPVGTSFVSTRTLTATVPAGLANGWYTATLTNGDGRTATVSDALLVDGTAPTGSILAQGWTSPYLPVTVTLTISATDATSSVSQMLFSTDGLSYSDWEAYGASKVYTATAGTSSIFARFKDAAGNISQPVSTTVTLDATPPAGSVQAQGWTSPWNPVTVTLTLSATDSTSGVSQMSFSSDDQTYSAWESFGMSSAYSTLTGTTSIFARFKDQAGNVSGPVSATVTLDSVPPTGTLAINGGAYDSTGITVTLALSATDSLSGVAGSSYSNDGTAWSTWETFASGKQWAVTEGDGAKTVWTRFRDAAGNISTPVSKTINLDTSVNGIAGVSINDGSLYTNQVTVTLSLPVPFQTAEMIISNDGAFAGVPWEPYAAYKPWAITRYGSYVIPRTVYVKYKDLSGNISSTYQDDIILDVNAPTGSVSIATGSGGNAAPGDVTLGLSATDLETGVGGMMISGSPTFSGTTWLQFQPNAPWNFGSDSKVYTVFKDNAGNASPVYALTPSGARESLPSLVLGTVHPKTGGDLVSEETKMAVSFPPGAVDSKADLTMVPAAESDLGTSVESLADRSIAFDYDTGRLGSAGKFLTLTAKAGSNRLTSFGKSFRLSVAFDYDTGRISRGIAYDYDTGRLGRIKASTLAIYSWNGTRWVKETGSVWDASSRTVSASVNHLSSFAVLGEIDTTTTIYLPVVTREASGW